MPVNTQGQPISQAPGSIVPSSSNAMLVTSGAARTATADNVSKLAGATQGLIPQQTDAQRSAAVTDSGQTPAPGGTTINIGNTGGATTTTPAPADNGIAQARINGGTFNGSDGKTYYNYDSSAVQSDSTTTTGTDNAAAAAAIKDPALAAQVKSSLDNLDTEKTQAQANLDAAKATLANDPAAEAAIDSISQKYDTLISAMKDKNAIIAGRNNTSVAAFGGLGAMSQNFLSNQADKANQRVADLVAQEQDLILKATIAYKNNDVKALNDAMTAYNKANSDKLKAVNDLLNEVNKQVKQTQDEAKAEAAADKAAVATDISVSTNIATSIAKSIADSGITDQKQIDAYINQMATQNGITNTEILRGAVTKAQQQTAKDALAAKNTNSIINKRNAPGSTSTKGGGTDGGFAYTNNDVAAYTALLNTGGTDNSSGTAYNGRGKDGYVDPGAYVAALNNWVSNGGTPTGFAKKFPVKGNVNPASYSILPAAIRPAATKSTPA